MDDNTRTELEAAAFRGLVEHLRRRSDVPTHRLLTCTHCQVLRRTTAQAPWNI